MSATNTLKAGALAYVDSFTGLIPVKVLAVRHDPYFGMVVCDVRVTGDRPGWQRRERDTLPTTALVTRQAGATIVRAFDTVEVDA